MLEWLTAEWERALERVRPSHLEWMASKGVASEALERAGGFGVCRARFEPATGLYEPSEDGEAAALLPVRSVESPECPDEILFDIVAFRPSDPTEIHRRRADAVWLGERELLTAEWLGLPATIRRTPLSWLRAGARGIVPLSWQEAIPRLLTLRELEGEDAETAAFLRRVLAAAVLRSVPLVNAAPAPVPADPPDAPDIPFEVAA
jgi:hypothetical protein